MLKAKRRMSTSVLQKCLQVARKCLDAFYANPFDATMMTLLGGIIGLGWWAFLAMFLMWFITMIDVWTGFVEVRKNPELEDNSDGLKQKVPQLLTYEMCLAVPVFLSIFFPYMTGLVWGMFFYFAWVEGKSIVENMEGCGYEVRLLKKALNIWEGTLEAALDRLSTKQK